MKTLILADNVSGVTVAAQTGVSANATPFLEGRDVVLHVNSNGLTVTPTILVQTSPDNVTWTTVATHTLLVNKQYNVKCGRYNRTNVTVGAGAGTYSAYMVNGA